MERGQFYLVTGISTKGAVKDLKMKFQGERNLDYRFTVKDAIGIIPFTFVIPNLEDAKKVEG